MPDTKITALAAITTVDPAADVLPIVDISDTSMAASGTTKKITSNQILGAGGTATLASATITGALTLTGGTANGVPYLNASKVVTTGTNLSFANTPGFFDSTFNINSLLGSALYRGGITVSEDNASFTLFGGSGYKLIQTSGFSTPNQLSFYASNAEQYRIGASGVFTWLDGAGGTRMTLDASGNLLVGTTAPLQISNNPAVTSRIANLGTGSKGSVILRENEVSAFWGGNLFLQKVRGTSTAVQSGDILGTVAFGGFDGTNYVNTAVIQTSVTGAVSAGVVPVKIQVVATSGGVELTNTATSWAAISDERLKDIIEPINNAVAKVGLLRSVIGKYKSDSEGTRRSFLIAQDVQSALPEAVGGNEDSMTVRYTEVIPLLVAAIKELTARVQTLEAK
jgi:hypothetical protein